jgi:hypothetical protein
MSGPMLTKGSPRKIYTLPTIIAGVSGVGLIFALLGDGIWDVMSWLAVGLPLALAAWAWSRSTPLRRKIR